jgi:hypothetical protein
MSDGPAYFVDPKAGDDGNRGTREAAWRTLEYAVGQLKPGDVLYLRGGVYYEHVTVKAKGTSEKPITIRSFPGELAVIDGGLREFFETPAAAWEPCPDGADGEFRSVKTYPDLGGSDGGTNVLGNFGDSMVPLHGCRFLADLRNSNEYFYKLNAAKTEAGDGVYCGPGVFYDTNTGRIHVRLAHTHQKALGTDNYRGETDPRNVPLVIAGLNAGSPLSIDGARYLSVQDIVVRGARTATVSVTDSFNIVFDGVTAYGGSTAFAVRESGGLRLWNCALRGIAAPWTYRASLKYRAIEARIFSASGWAPTGADNHDFELAYSEFTDCVDGVFTGNVKNVRFHHNLLENLSDDGIFLTAGTAYDGTTPGGNVHIYQNLLSRCLTTCAFGVGHGRQKMTPLGRQAGAGVFIYRNIFDFRRPVMYTQPKEDELQIASFGRVAGDHGGPLWEPMTIYHNTILPAEPPFRNYYLSGMGGHLAEASMRRLFNNIVVQTSGPPGNVLPSVVPPESATRAASALSAKMSIGFQADGNLHWSQSEQTTFEVMFTRFRGSPDYQASKQLYRPGWAAHDVVADPKFVSFDANWQAALDCRLRPDSTALNAGVPIPDDWPDPLRAVDRGKPDIGAIPAGVGPWRIGARGRLTAFGVPAQDGASVAAPIHFLLDDSDLPKERESSECKPAIIVQGYPAFDAPLVEFALRRSRSPFESLERTWLDPAEYGKYRMVVIAGNLARAKIEPNKYDRNDLKHVDRFLEGGGVLMLMRGNAALFGTPDGGEYLAERTGASKGTPDKFDILLPDHTWLRHLDLKQASAWLNPRGAEPIRAARGDIVIGNRTGLATLCRVPVGKGQLIYIGWDVAASLPQGRQPSTVEQEMSFEQQMQILLNVVDSIIAAATGS